METFSLLLFKAKLIRLIISVQADLCPGGQGRHKEKQGGCFPSPPPEALTKSLSVLCSAEFTLQPPGVMREN